MRRLAAGKFADDGLLLKFGLHGLEQIEVQNGLMLSLMGLAAIDDLADIKSVLEQVGERPDAPAFGLDGLPVRQ